MKADMTACGTIVLTPESSLESFALMRWSERAIVRQPDLQRGEQIHFRGSSIIVDMSDFLSTLPLETPP